MLQSQLAAASTESEATIKQLHAALHAAAAERDAAVGALAVVADALGFGGGVRFSVYIWHTHSFRPPRDVFGDFAAALLHSWFPICLGVSFFLLLLGPSQPLFLCAFLPFLVPGPHPE